MSSDLVLLLSLTCLGGVAAFALRLPPLVGFLGAGFVLAALGVPHYDALTLVADLGVVLLLFAIGLKIDPRGLLRREVLGVAVTHMVVAGLVTLGFLALLALLGLSLVSEADLGAWWLLAVALSFSSTVVAVKTLDEQSSEQSLFGRTAIGILVIQDIVAVVVLSLAEGETPSWWALTIPLLLPAAYVVGRTVSLVGHGELLPLVALVLALVPGYAFFDAVGLKGDLGALVMGMLMASSPRAEEMAKSLFSVKELLLVAFFVSVGLTGTPSLGHLGAALVLLLLLPVKGGLFTVLLRAARLRDRTATHAAVSLTSFSEFALIVAAVATSSGLLADDWLIVLSTAVALSFVIAPVLGRRIDPLTGLVERLFPDRDPSRLHPEDRPIDLERADAVVLGMGRVGQAAHRRLTEAYDLHVVGVESDAQRVRALRARGLDVVEGDATDALFWERLTAEGSVELAVLAMPFHGSNLAALQRLERSRFSGAVAMITRYDEETEQVRDRVDTVFGLYDAAGTELADQAADDAGLEPRVS